MTQAAADADRSVTLLYLLTGALQHEMQMAERDAFRIAQGMVRWMAPQVGGDVLYCPKTLEQDRAVRDAAIRREFNGRNREEICAKHRISKSRLYQILAEVQLHT
ncbi:MAG: hypothetical protein NDI84_08010 [Steroidobacteraceae bacterium]|nr:hypothetical protein [Steroidobacteraceae bacterium]